MSCCSCFPFSSCCSDNCCPYPQWMHPLCGNPARYCAAGLDNGPTLIIHVIVLEAGREQSCTPRPFNLRITGPSYPAGEVFTLRAGSCLELDEPLVISGLIPGQYTIEQLFGAPNEYISTCTGPVCGRCVLVTNSAVPTVVTLVNRRRQCRCCGFGFGCGSGCGCFGR